MSEFQKRVKSLAKKIVGLATIQTEVNVKKLFKEYSFHDHHYDIVIPSYKIIIECHGEQHRSLCSFGKEEGETSSVQRLVSQKHRDRLKEDTAWKNGWGYAIIWHNELSSNDEKALAFLKSKILEAIRRREDNEDE